MKISSTTADVSSQPSTIVPLRTVGPYELLDSLGEGGMGSVYSARDTRSDRMVALKMLRGFSGPSLFRLKREFRTLADLQHRNVIVPYELFVHDEMLCYSMELVRGQTIVHYAASGRDRLRSALEQLADAVETIHEHGTIHRDLKPENVLVTDEGRVVLLDFGIAKTLSDDIEAGVTIERSWLGTPAYMAPEQFRTATPSVAGDLYALGSVMYEAATGHQAFEQVDINDLLEAKRSRMVPPAPELGELEQLVMNLLDPEPGNRPSAHAVKRALRSAPEELVVETRPEPFSVGRRAELERLREVIRSSRDSHRLRAASVVGDAGMGKTQLLDRLALAARKDGAFVATARCTALESLPLRIVDRLLDDVISTARWDGRIPIERCYPRHAATMVRVFPCTAVLFGDTTSGVGSAAVPSPETPALALGAVSDFLARLAEHVPLVVCIDDLHRSDEDGLEALLRLVLDLGESRVSPR
jgi:eukaryotic-like serine/threonine-protein kinase